MQPNYVDQSIGGRWKSTYILRILILVNPRWRTEQLKTFVFFLIANVAITENFSIYYNDNVFNDEMLHAWFYFHTIFSRFLPKKCWNQHFFPVYRLFDDSLDKEIGREGGRRARGLRIVVWCHLENIFTYWNSFSRYAWKTDCYYCRTWEILWRLVCVNAKKHQWCTKLQQNYTN